MIPTEFTEIKGIIRERYGRLYANKLNNPEKVGKFPGRHKLLKLSQKKHFKNLNRFVTIKEIELIIKKLPPKETSMLRGFMVNSTKF